ncbi:MAG: tRNA (N(6)-L-threonylcarbamoyladenosine(37)-C(2))-methylthiotransferase MtaB [Chloroflexi bacterium]|nr:tRNA (N(6)-L-threonylcarbamoyladenosine(37)-C(2))-methylthiotransferase MtaB [Chloroflexota bacterium]
MIEIELQTRPRVAIETHGCKLNQADSGGLATEFAEAGFDVVGEDTPVDVYVVNSCTVTHVADSKARHALRSARRRHPNATIVATGCYAQREPETLRQLDEVDLVVGNTEKSTLVRHVVDWAGDEIVPCATGDDVQAISPTAARTRAMVKIQEGCNQVCAYCIVPKVRGRERSIPPDEIVGKIEEYTTRGYKEVVLTGTQLGSYGFDLEGIDLAGLIGYVLERCSMARLRVSSLQAHEIDERLLALWSDDRLAPHFHLPLQSGSDAVLKRMRRRYDSRQFLEAVDGIRQAIPDAAITTDVIAGFPGETEREFEDTYRLCREVGFASMHVFPYSARPGTSAAHFRDDVPPQVKSERVGRFIELAQEQAARYRGRFLGTSRRVLWESHKAGEWVGLTDNYIRVAARSDRELTNEITWTRIIGLNGKSVIAQVE